MSADTSTTAGRDVLASEGASPASLGSRERLAAGSTLLEVADLHVRFHTRRQDVFAVNGLSYRLAAGTTLAIIGESGSGKTVSARALMGLLPPTATVEGSIRFQGTELVGLTNTEMRRHRGAELAMVFQDPSRSLDPTMRIGDQITEALRAHRGVARRQADRRAIELLEMVRLPAPRRRFHEYPHQLSGGMRQRVMIAIALSCEPKVLIADEATTALDVTTQAQIMELLLDLQERLGTAVIVISHDLGLAATYADEVIVMYAGRAVEQAPISTLFESVRMPYTKVLLDAIPRIARPPHSLLPVVEGRPPDLTNLPAGCAFATRCPIARDDCSLQVPPFEEHEPGHAWACWHPYREEDHP